jgi:serine/threonine-protein kinase HipA
MLAYALPDRFGNAVIDAWLVTQGRLPGEIDAVERLCYIGSRGMGALEFRPAFPVPGPRAAPIEIAALVELASRVLSQRQGFATSFEDGAGSDGLRDILRVGTSAGGARAKAVIAWNPTTNEVRSCEVPSPAGFEPWILKFDGVSGNEDRDVGVPLGYGALEYAYSRMARAAGISMSETRLFEEGGRRHFMVRRFDRTPEGAKVHMQSLAALAHFDYNRPGEHSY